MARERNPSMQEETPNREPTRGLENKPLQSRYTETGTTEEQEGTPEEEEEQAKEPREKRPRVSRLERLEQKKAQIENQIKALHARESEKERKGRTRRLIQIGALSEKYLNCEGIEPKEYETILKQLVAVQEVKAILKRD